MDASKLFRNHIVRVVVAAMYVVAMVVPAAAIWGGYSQYVELSLTYSGWLCAFGLVYLLTLSDETMRERASRAIPMLYIYALEVVSLVSVITLMLADYPGVASLQFMFNMYLLLRKYEESIYLKSITSPGS